MCAHPVSFLARQPNQGWLHSHQPATLLVDLKQGPVQAAVLNGLGDVVGGDVFGALQVGDGAGDF